MHKPICCIFPDTLPRDKVLFPLVQVLPRIVYYQPVEEQTAVDSCSPLGQSLITADRLLLHIPAPLGQDRNRFLALIHDITQRGGDYMAQLAQLSLAGMTRGQRAMESRPSIISTLLGQSGITGQNQDITDLALWQARLVLKLAEQFEREQKELEKQLEKITCQQNGLVRELREEDNEDEIFSLTRSLQGHIHQQDQLTWLRCKAWTRLFCLGSSRMEPDLLITTHSDCLERLLEKYVVLSGVAAAPPLRLLLPTYSRKKASAPVSEPPSKPLVSCTSLLDSGWSDTEGRAIQKRCQLDLDDRFPETTFDRVPLSLYHLTDISAAALLWQTFGHGLDLESRAMINGSNQPRDCIVGYLGTT